MHQLKCQFFGLADTLGNFEKIEIGLSPFERKFMYAKFIAKFAMPHLTGVRQFTFMRKMNLRPNGDR